MPSAAPASASPALTDRPDCELITTRELAFPRELVWKALTDPQHLPLWWGPDGFRNTVHEIDVRPGGGWRFMMHGPDGTDWPNKIVYRELKAPERIVYDHSDDKDNSDIHFVGIITLDDLGGRTLISLRIQFATKEERDRACTPGAIEGGKQTLGRLDAYLAGPAFALVHHLSTTRLLNAPRELVFRTWTEIEHLNQWCHLTHLPTTHMEIDARVGGVWRIRLRGEDGSEVDIYRVFREVTPPSRLVFTELCTYGGARILDGLLTVTFEEEAGKTRVTISCELVKPFDTENQDGWNDGWGDLLDKLAVLLPKL